MANFNAKNSLSNYFYKFIPFMHSSKYSGEDRITARSVFSGFVFGAGLVLFGYALFKFGFFN